MFAYNNHIKHKNDFLLLYNFFIDGSAQGANAMTSIYPVLMTLGIFNRKTRRAVAAWRPIGFYSKASIGLSKERQYGPFCALKDDHFQLDHIFDELVHIQEANGFLYD